MGMVVRTNTMSNNAYRQLGMNNSQLSKSLEKLSSGFRINRAGDDSSGLAISEKMKAQIAGLDQASANSQDGISLVQTAEGALTEVHSMLNRMVTLAEKSANGTIQNDVDREAIQTETDALKDEITRVSKSTNFNGISLLDGTLGGSSGAVDVSAATINGASANITTNPATASSYEATAGVGTAAATKLTVNYTDESGKAAQVTLGYTGSVTAADNGTAMATAIKADKTLSSLFDVAVDGAGKITITSKTTGSGAPAITSMTSQDAETTALGAGTATAGAAAYNTLNATGLKAGDSITINGKNYEFVAADGDATKDSSAVAVTVGAAATDSLTNLQKVIQGDDKEASIVIDSTTLTTTTFKAAATTVTGKGLTLQVGDTNADYNKVTVNIEDMSASGLGISSLNVSTQDAAGSAIDTIKSAINKVSTNRGNLGALQNRLEHAISNLDTTSENMSSANSAIRDTDMAKEMMNYTKMNILSQAAQAMLAQANQQPQNILQLLK